MWFTIYQPYKQSINTTITKTSYSHYTDHPVLAGTPSEQLEDLVFVVLALARPTVVEVTDNEQDQTPSVQGLHIPDNALWI